MAGGYLHRTWPSGSGRVDLLTHPHTTVACAARVVTGTAGRDSSRYRYRGNRRTRQLVISGGLRMQLSEIDTHKTPMKICGGVVSLSFIFPHPPEDGKINQL